ncbi:MAG TPA: hypothetical protein VLL97_05150, partial [Acidobacteriota bacterium]|nr:hypothetical protein [Acidobacteriota bacterium]
IMAAGAVRSFDEESAISVANWGGARWVIMGKIAPARRGVYVTIDFIPTQGDRVPFRFIQNRRLQHLGTSFHDALRQFARYRSARLFPPSMGNEPGMDRMKALAEAVDREYGWFVVAEPGSAGGIVGNLEPADMPLARILFNPGVYPELSAMTAEEK